MRSLFGDGGMCDRCFGILGVRSLFEGVGNAIAFWGVVGAIAVLRFEEVRSLCRDVEGVR